MLQNKLGYSIMFSPVDDGKYTKDKVRKILREQLQEHIGIMNDGAMSEKQAFDALNVLVHTS